MSTYINDLVCGKTENSHHLCCHKVKNNNLVVLVWVKLLYHRTPYSCLTMFNLNICIYI